MYYLRLTRSFARASMQNELAYRSNFWISLLHACLNLGVGVLGVIVLFGQVEQVNGWDLAAMLVLLGVYLTLSAVRGLFIGPSLDAQAGMDGDIWSGRFDYTLLRPVDVQFHVSVRDWRPLALIDLALGIGVLLTGMLKMGQTLTLGNLLSFTLVLAAGLVILYAILLAFAGLIFWSPGFLFTWLFDAFFQMARYPVQLYPGWLRLILTWVIPVGLMTTLPAQTVRGATSPWVQAGSLLLALIFFVAATVLFRTGLRRYASASS